MPTNLIFNTWKFLLKVAQSNLGKRLDRDSVSNTFLHFTFVLSFFAFFLVGILFYVDLYALDALISGSILENLFSIEKGQQILKIEGASFRVLYALNFVLAVALSIVLSIFFYLRHGGKHNRSDQAGFYFHGWLIPCLVHFVAGWFLLCIWLYGGYLISIVMLEKLGANQIPAFCVVSIIINTFVYQLVTSGLVNQWMLILPYSFHPANIRTKINLLQ